MKYPTIIKQHHHNNISTLTLRVSSELEAFSGHFDSFSIIPGVVQIQWALHYFKQTEQSDPTVSDYHVNQMSALKFQQVITPDTDVNLALSFDESKHCLTFSITNDEHKYSSGKLFLTTS